MANKHILRIHETEADLLSELKNKQIAWATDINQAIWRSGNNFYYIEASKYWNGTEFIEINSDQIYNVYTWDDYVTALSDVGNIKYIYMRENIQAPSVLTQNLDVYGQCEVIVYTGSQIFSADPSGASNCELRYRGSSGSPAFTSLNFLGNSITYVGFETLFVTDVYCRNEEIISSLPIDVQITNGAELGTSKFQYESQDGNFTCSVGASDFIRELWTMPIFEIQTLGNAQGYKPKGTDFFNNGASVYSNMSADDLDENFVGDVYTRAFLGLVVTTAQITGILKTNFVGGSVQWAYSDLDVWNPSAVTGNAITFFGRGIDFTNGVSISPDLECSLSLKPSVSNDTLKIGDIADTQNDIYVDVLNLDGNVTLDPASTHNIYYQKINLNGFTLTDSGNVAIQQFWRSTTGDKLDSVVAGSNVTIDNTDPQNPIINASASAVAGGSNTHVQFYDSGSFGGDSNFTFDKNTGDVFVGGNLLLNQDKYSQLIGGVGAVDTIGVLNFNDVSNCRSGSGRTLLNYLTQNAPQQESSSSNYWHTFNFEAYDKDGTGNITQLAVPYGNTSGMGSFCYRSRYNYSWTPWRVLIASHESATERVFQFPNTTNNSPTNGDIWFDGTNFNVHENGVSSVLAKQNVDNNFSTDQTFQGDINASQVVNLASYNNVSPITGDIWRDSTSGAIEIEGDTTVNGDLDVTGSVFLSSNRRLYANSYVDLEDETGWGVRVDGTNDALRPLVDNDTELGLSSRRWSESHVTDSYVYGDLVVTGNTNVRIGTTTSTASLSIDTDLYDQYNVTALAVGMTINAPTNGSDGKKLIIRIKDSGSAQSLTWNAIFRAIGVTLPNTTTANKTIYVGCIYNNADSKWDAIAVAEEA